MRARRSADEKPRPKKAPWPAGKPIPNFKSLAEEETFWLLHTFEDGAASDWQEIEYQGRRRSRSAKKMPAAPIKTPKPSK